MPPDDQWPKEARTVALPDELLGFLAEASAKIEGGDVDAITESDDLLQCDFAYGGRNEEGGDEWGFTYLLPEPSGAKWELKFAREQLRELATGSVEPCVTL